MKLLSYLFIFLIILSFPVSVFGSDAIKMKNGKIIEGEIIDEDTEILRVKTKAGEVELNREDIEWVKRNFDFDKEFQERLKSAESGEEFYQLGQWCKEFGRSVEAKQCFEKAISIDPEHKKARTELGYKKDKDGQWVLEKSENTPENGKANNGKKEESPLSKKSNADSPKEPIKALPQKPEEEKPSEKGWKEKPLFTMEEYRDTLAICPWEQRKTIETKHYTVYTNTKDEYSKKYCDLLEKLWEKYCKVFGFSGEAPYKPKVCIFANQQEFIRVTRMAGAGGFYTPATKTLQVFHGWIPTLESGTQQVIQHEGTHQFQDMVMRSMMSSPIWLLEGLAVFFEASVLDESGKLHIGAIPAKRLQDLQASIKSNRYIKLANLIKQPQGGFGVPHYNHAWSLIYWLVYTSDHNQKIFNKYWTQCCERGDSRDSRGFLETIGVDIEQLEEHWKEWVLIIDKDDMPEDVKRKTEDFNKKWRSEHPKKPQK